jgi:O-antigen/teichoic acid export membrane protein
VNSSIYGKIAHSSAIYGTGVVAARLASFLLLPVYTRCLTTADYGILELLETTLSVFSMFLGGRFADALFYHYSGEAALAAKNRILSSMAMGAWLIGGIGGLIGLASSPAVSRLVFENAVYTRYFQIVFIGFALSVPLEVGFAWLRAIDRPVIFVSVSILRLGLTLALTILLVVFRGMQVLGVLYSNLAVTAAMAVGLTGVCLWRTGLSFESAVFFRALRFSLPLGLGGIGLFVIHSGDRFFLQRYVSLADLGIYALAYKLGMLVSQVQVAFSTYWTAHGYDVLRSEQGARVFAKLNTYMLAVIIWAGVAVIAFSPPVLRFMAAPQYLPALRYVPWIVLAYVLRAEADYFRFLLYVDGRTSADAALITVSAVICVAGYALLIPIYKLGGAVAATFLAFVVLTAGARLVARQKRPYPIERHRLVHLSLPAAGILAALVWLDIGPGWGQWALACAAVAAYPFLLTITGFFQAGERAALLALLQRIGRRALLLPPIAP